jgi:hypothetical protein
MVARTPLLASLAALTLLACGAPPAPVPASGVREDTAKAIAAFQGVEDEVLRDLATIDRRVAARARIEPQEEDLRRVTMGAVLAEDATLAVIDGAVDPFSFEARARGLSAARAKLESAPLGLPASAQGVMPAPALERELLARLVDAELVRLEEERALPRSASALVRGLVETWRAPANPQQAAERDRWLARRLDEMLAALNATANRPKGGSAPLDVVRARELDDALDALEHAIDAAGLGQSTTRLVQLREALELQGTRPAAGAVSSWNDLARGMRAHLGLTLTAEALDARLATTETELAKAAAVAVAQARIGSDVAESRAAPLIFAPTPCTVAIPGSRLRSMAPPPERATACRLQRLLTSATDDTSRAVALLVLHDHATVARWALDVARGTATIAQATAKHRPLSRPGPDVIAKWERIALAQATTAIGAGVAAGVLYGKGDPTARARAWSELGDVPLDIADREIR